MIYSPNVTDSGVACLSRLVNLEELTLGSRNITDQSIATLSSLKNLKRCDIRRTGISEKGMIELQKALPNCQIQFDARILTPPLTN